MNVVAFECTKSYHYYSGMTKQEYVKSVRIARNAVQVRTGSRPNTKDRSVVWLTVHRNSVWIRKTN